MYNEKPADVKVEPGHILKFTTSFAVQDCIVAIDKVRYFLWHRLKNKEITRKNFGVAFSKAAAGTTPPTTRDWEIDLPKEFSPLKLKSKYQYYVLLLDPTTQRNYSNFELADTTAINPPAKKGRWRRRLQGLGILATIAAFCYGAVLIIDCLERGSIRRATAAKVAKLEHTEVKAPGEVRDKPVLPTSHNTNTVAINPVVVEEKPISPPAPVVTHNPAVKVNIPAPAPVQVQPEPPAPIATTIQTGNTAVRTIPAGPIGATFTAESGGVVQGITVQNFFAPVNTVGGTIQVQTNTSAIHVSRKWPNGFTENRKEKILKSECPGITKTNVSMYVPAGMDYIFTKPPGWIVTPWTSLSRYEIEAVSNIGTPENPEWVPAFDAVSGTYTTEFRCRSLGKPIDLIFKLERME